MIFFVNSTHAIAQFEDSFITSNWPNSVTGDTQLFLRQKGYILSNSNNTSKHTYSIQFPTNNPEEFILSCNVAINLSSSNFICWGWKNQNGVATYLKIGNAKDQWQFFQDDTLIKSGTEQEFNVSKFSTEFKLYRKKDSLFFRYLSPQGNFNNYFLIKNITNFNKYSEGFLTIQQYGISAIGKHQFNYIYSGNLKIDTICPRITCLKQLNNHDFQLFFNAPIHKIDSSLLSSLNGKISAIFPINIYKTGYHFNFIPNTKNEDSIIFNLKELQTDNFKTLQSKSYKYPYKYCDTPEFGQLILTEIMHHPSNQNPLQPNCKYLEIWNNSAKYLDLTNCKLRDNSKSFGTFPPNCMKPNDILVLCSSSDTLNFQNINYLSINKFPNFNIEEDKIECLNQEGRVLFNIIYSEKWHNLECIDGGYSLIKHNFSDPTNEYFNWVSNQFQTNSLGNINSSYKQKLNRKIIENYIKNDTIYFRTNYTINPSDSSKIDCDAIPNLKSIIRDNLVKIINQNRFNHLIINFDTFKVSMHNSNLNSTKCRFNEILFHNYSQFPDFIEIINTDTSPIELSNLSIELYDNNGIYKSQFNLGNSILSTILPSQPLAFCNYPKALCQEFQNSDSTYILRISNFPSLSVFGGHLKLRNLFLNEIIDEMDFNEDMFSDFLISRTGVSLEKIDAQLNSENKSNWTNTPISFGAASPGKLNSNQLQKSSTMNIKNSHFNILDKVINQLSYNPESIIVNYSMPQGGYWLKVELFTTDGIKVETLLNQYELIKQGMLKINTAINHQLLKTDNYILKFEALLPNKDIIQEKYRISIINR